MSTYRERREARAERLRLWAESRDTKAAQAYGAARQTADAIPFGQPMLVDHHSYKSDRNRRERMAANFDRSFEHAAKAESMRSRADNIEAAAKNAIYSDDPDAVERLEEKIARLEAQRETMKTRNAEYRKAHRAELKALTPYGRNHAVPFPPYALQNLSGNISRLRKRLEGLKR